ncbi:hypothetical protein F3J44_24220 [Pantoea sp. Tr-811]|uniref:hypothetical protein n=1 Tax=Pantoea sp. Tr-811 TaxID=2608361 RepID=UPI001424555D|nr:hypothetical protein [Pantoea sp. Tr-811]NIF29461.1 hypothetical protein [Pantoea sp. Tr-811]
MNTFKSSIQNVAAAIGLIAAVTVGGCVMIPYDTPESKAQIQHDLKIAPSDIQAVSETNWCLFPYGSDGSCRVTQGLGVLTSKGLILSLYKNHTYVETARILPEQVQCVKTDGGRTALEPFSVLTKDQAIMLAVITPGGRLNGPVKVSFFDYLTKPGQHVFTGADGRYVRKTGRHQTVGGMVSGTAIPWSTTLDVTEVYNPCPQVTD